MRGKVVDIVYQLQQEGITPAYAGKSWLAHDCRRKIRDHPRLCGEKEAIAAQPQEPEGSPPPMRGKETAGRDRNAR